MKKNALKIFMILIILLPLYLSCQQKNEYKLVKYDLVEIAQSDQLWTGVAVSNKGRIFVNYPRWSPNIMNSVGEIKQSGETMAFPNQQWNDWNLNAPAEKYFICVQSVYIDRNDYLWILDAGLDIRKGLIEKGPKLLKVNLQSNQIEQIIYFTDSAAPLQSYLNDIRVDTKLNYAYITDSGLGAIVVVNLKTETARRTLTRHSSTKAEGITLNIEGREWSNQIHSDGIALDANGDYLYYQALTGYSLYRIHTKWLKTVYLSEDEVGAKVEFLGKPGAADGIAFGSDGYLYLTSLELNAIRRFTPNRKVEMVIQDSRLKWPDSFSVKPSGDIYVTTSQLHLAGKHSEPFKIFRLSAMF